MVGWSGREGEYSCRRSGRFAGVVEEGVMALRQGHALSGNSSFSRTQRSSLEHWCDVYMEVHRLQNRLRSLDPPRCSQMKV